MNSIEEVKFNLTEAFTWGVTKNHYGSFSIPVVVNNDEDVQKIKNLEKYQTKNPLYNSNTLYLKSERLSEKQERELLHDGKAYIDIRFNVKEIYTKDGVNHIVFEVTKLRKSNKPYGTCPED